MRSRCSCCADRRNDRRDFRDGGVDIEDFEEPKYRRQSRKSKRVCAKSKTGEQCDFTVAIIKMMWYSEWKQAFVYHRVMTCSRCGKHGRWMFGESPTNPNN
jgi:hypothetical protein